MESAGHGRENLGNHITFIRVGFAVMGMAVVFVIMVDALRFYVSSVVFQLVLVQIFHSDHLGQRFLSALINELPLLLVTLMFPLLYPYTRMMSLPCGLCPHLCGLPDRIHIRQVRLIFL